ncbi:MAG: hypothetical protein L6R39_000610 [Caloplaca ligustica]|nr:MAG: hypothetical protein L6R39_000610 [Caloplaca ligustica]
MQNGTVPPTVPSPDCSDRNLHEGIWAKEGTGKSSHEIDPGVWRLTGLEPSDADLLRDPSDVQPLGIPEDHELGKAVEAAKADGQQRSMKSAIFYISPSNFTALQRDCVHELGAAAQVSGTHAICGLVWRCYMKAAAKRSDLPVRNGKIVRMDVLLDGRSGFSHSLPQTYHGNHTLVLQSLTALSALTSPNTSVASVTGMICENMRRIDSATLQDMYALLRDVPDFNAMHRRKWEPQMTSVSDLRLMITSVLMVPGDRVSFGDRVFRNRGKPDAGRVLMGAFNRSGPRLCYVLPRTTNGAVEFIVNLYPEEMDALLDDEEFGRYAMFLA